MLKSKKGKNLEVGMPEKTSKQKADGPPRGVDKNIYMFFASFTKSFTSPME